MINPYLPSDVFIPDGEPRLFGNRLYIYGSHDLYGTKHLCAGDYVCYSAPVNENSGEPIGEWRNEGVIYKREQDPFIDKILKSKKTNMFNQYLYAPDVIEIDGKYYLYYGVGLSGSGIGAAVSDSPGGPYQYIGRVHYPNCEKPLNWHDDNDMALGGGMPMISLNPFKKHFGLHMKNYVYDPAVILDNGRLFLFYGCGYCYMAELDVSDKITLIKNADTGSYISDPLLPSGLDKHDKEKIKLQNGWHMANGASIRKYFGKYFLSYYAVNGRGGHAICHSVSNEIYGPYEYKGVLVWLGDKDFHGAYHGNTHGGIVQIGDRFFINYHRQTGDKYPVRQACMQELLLNENAEFLQSEFATQVYGAPLKPNGRYPAYCACSLSDKNGITKKGGSAPYFHLSDSKQVIKGLHNGGIVCFKYFDLNIEKSGEYKVLVCLKNASNGDIQIFLDEISDKSIFASIQLEPGKRDTEGIYKASINSLPKNQKNVHALIFKFISQSKATEFLWFDLRTLKR